MWAAGQSGSGWSAAGSYPGKFSTRVSLFAGITFDAIVYALANSHASGDVVTQVGNSLWSRVGRVGATTGSGNCDLLVSSDGTHPSPAGHAAIGRGVRGPRVLSHGQLN